MYQHEVTTEKNGTFLLQEFSDWREFIELAEDGPCTMREYDRASRAITMSPSWDMNLGFNGAIELAKTGWTDRASQAERIADPLVEKITSRIERSDWYTDMSGDCLDIGRYCGGLPDCWQAVKHTVIEGKGNKIISIVINPCVSASIESETIAARGVATVALIYLLELAGYRCDVRLRICDGRGSPNQVITDIPLKEPDDTVSLPFLLYAIAHPATFRRLWFSIGEQLPADLRQVLHIPGGYGKVIDAPPELQGDIYLAGYDSGESYNVDWTNSDAVFAWLVAQLRKSGVELKD
jgi:hypothetical protein